MLKFLKKFLKEEEKIIEKIEAEGLDKWFNKKADEFKEQIKTKIEEFKTEVKVHTRHTQEELENLKTASLRNPKISTREIQFMEGNRKAYIQKVELFIRHIEEITQNELDYFLLHYNEYVDNLAKSSGRSYSILQEFFANETKDVAAKIKRIDDLVERIKRDKMIRDNSRIEKIRKEFESVEHKSAKSNELKDNLAANKKKLDHLKKEKEEKKSRKNRIIMLKEYEEIQRLSEKIKKNNKEIKETRDELYFYFAPMQRVLKKYQRISFAHDKLIEHYQTDAENALMTDSNLKIVEILHGLKDQIEKGKIDDKKADKIIQIIDKLDKDYFEKYVEKFNLLKKEKADAVKALEENSIRMELEQIENRIENIESRKKELEERIAADKQELDSINLDKIKAKIKEDIEDCFRIKIELI